MSGLFFGTFSTHSELKSDLIKNDNKHWIDMIGIGTTSAQLTIYIKNTPPTPPYNDLAKMQILEKGNIHNIVTATGNHWRKIFNVYAKLLFGLNSKGFKTWQMLRDEYLFQEGSHESLVFSSPCKTLLQPSYLTSDMTSTSPIHIIMGKTYAIDLGIAEYCEWLSPDFAIHKPAKVIICPYFDYRQLSNIKIEKLAQLIRQLQQA